MAFPGYGSDLEFGNIGTWIDLSYPADGVHGSQDAAQKLCGVVSL